MALPYGIARWHCQMPKFTPPDAKVHPQMALPEVTLPPRWHCQMALPDGLARWHCHVALGGELWKLGGKVTSKMDGVDGCEIPIGRDDTRGVAVCVLYRNGLYRRKIGEKGVEKYAKTRGKCQILHEWVVPWSF